MSYLFWDLWETFFSRSRWTPQPAEDWRCGRGHGAPDRAHGRLRRCQRDGATGLPWVQMLHLGIIWQRTIQNVHINHQFVMTYNCNHHFHFCVKTTTSDNTKHNLSTHIFGVIWLLQLYLQLGKVLILNQQQMKLRDETSAVQAARLARAQRQAARDAPRGAQLPQGAPVAVGSVLSEVVFVGCFDMFWCWTWS